LSWRKNIANSQKTPRALRPKDMFPPWFGVQESERVIEEAKVARAKKLSKDPAIFFKQIVGFEPTKYQRELIKLFLKHQFTAMRWARQSGKSWICAALLLWYALTHADSYIGIVAPSWRQAKLVIRRINFFLRKLPQTMYLRPMRTIIRFTNGSVIEAFPNSPETIRGPSLSCIYWDESNFTPNDIDLWTAILFTISTTKGKVLVSSTPWNIDSVFYRMFHGEEFREFGRSHVTYRDALMPNGPLDPKTLEAIKKQFEYDPWRWRRECEAEWAEDENVWLPQSLIVSCVGTEKNCGEDLQLWDENKGYTGDLFCGLDLAQVRDYCVFSAFQRLKNVLLLRHLKIFSQPTKYANVLGYVKTLQDRWGGFQKIRVDFTREGPSIISDMEDAGIRNAEGVNFSLARKSEMASLLKQRMLNKQLFYPHFVWEKPYRSDICSELNVEKFELRKDGAIILSHPTGSHDDVFWSVALAVYATVEMKPVDLEALKLG